MLTINEVYDPFLPFLIHNFNSTTRYFIMIPQSIYSKTIAL